jgi:hypothetical protein
MLALFLLISNTASQYEKNGAAAAVKHEDGIAGTTTGPLSCSFSPSGLAAKIVA